MAKSPSQNVPSTPLLMTQNNNGSPSSIVPQSSANIDPWRSPETSISIRNIRTPVQSPGIFVPNSGSSSWNNNNNDDDKSEATVVFSQDSSTSDQQVPGTPVQSSKTPSNRQKVHQQRCSETAKTQELSDDSLIAGIPALNLFSGEEIFI